MLGLYVLNQPAELWTLCKEMTPPAMVYMSPEAGKTPCMPPVTVGRVYFDNEAQLLVTDPPGFGRNAAAKCVALAKTTNIPVWVGTNEPDVSSTAAMERLVAFETEFTQRLNSEGLRAAVFSLSVGWPRQLGPTNVLDTGPLDAFLRTLSPINMVAVHEYFTPNGPLAPFTYPNGYQITPYTGAGPSLCWRFKLWPQLDNHYILVTECGMDIWGRPATDGWRKQCPPGMNLEQWFDRYCAMMADYMNLIGQDKRVLGAMWFCAGPGYGWENYDMIDHWRQAKALLTGPEPQLPSSPPVVIPTAPTIRLKFSITGEIVTMPLEEYLRGVVPAEMPALWNAQAVRAQAVLARSYALACKERRANQPYDVDDTTRFQVYAPSMIHPASDAAVRDTAGVYLVQNGHPYFAEYKARCGRADCPFCNGAPGSITESNPAGVWPNNACAYGMRTLADEGHTWRVIALWYYPSDVRLNDDGGGTTPPEGATPTMWDDRLNAYSEANGKVTGVKCLVEPHDTIRTKFGNPVLPQGGWYWKCVGGAFFDEDQSQGAYAINVNVVDENGAPAPCSVWFAYPSERMGNANWVGAFDNGSNHSGDVFAYMNGSGAIAQGANAFDPKSGKIGPYIVGVFSAAEPGGVISSELVFGMGMPYNHHVSYAFTFQRTQLGAVTPPTPGGTGCNLAAAVKAFFDALA